MTSGFLAALQMNKDNIWSEIDDKEFEDERRFKLAAMKKIDDQTLQLSFDNPNGFTGDKGDYVVFRLLDPKFDELDVSYRWLPIASSEESKLDFTIELKDNSFSKSCESMEIGEEALVFGPMT